LGRFLAAAEAAAPAVVDDGRGRFRDVPDLDDDGACLVGFDWRALFPAVTGGSMSISMPMKASISFF